MIWVYKGNISANESRWEVNGKAAVTIHFITNEIIHKSQQAAMNHTNLKEVLMHWILCNILQMFSGKNLKPTIFSSSEIFSSC